ncbi:5'-methylthioadenosine/S-adenosylhomocysteine nucleosidase family protein [Rhodoblastus sp.]|uniref:5'-methylthioadenosine/S-adenosylhomocysteine nucleosidase family protein n=1 Tax=Rhodoblastus sp. TaxID=1962975 RepID=UPI003FD8F075
MTFEQPIKGDLDRALSLLMHDHRHKLMEQCNLIKSDAIKAGTFQSNRVVVMAIKAADDLHKEAMTQATAILLDYIERMQRPPAEIVGWARPHLENLGNSLLGVVPPNNFPQDHQRLVRQYSAVFGQRLDGILRDVEIGFVKGAGFARAEQMESTEQWITASEASHLLKAAFNSEYLARKAICKRAHGALIRARAEQFIVAGEVRAGCELPKEFWWAEGEAALTQNWITGDFDTWIKQQLHLEAFGVSFLRADIEKMVPAAVSEPASARSSQANRSAIVLTALHVETVAVLRHLSDLCEETERGTVFQVGRFGEWRVAVAECGEGNAHSAATVERGIARFKPEVALFIGVAGGIKDVSIGDALVSTKVYGYERGKDTEQGFKPRPAVELSAYALEQRARAIRLKTDWRARLDPTLRHENPQIYIGPIAAGEKVISSSSGKIAEFLKENYGDALGVEMEGQGFLGGVHINAPVQGCVVRGISDLLDAKAEADKAGSQKIAADVASAVAFEMFATLWPVEAPERISRDEQQPGAVQNSKQQEGARLYLAPELYRTIERALYIHGRARANFVCASTEKAIKPNDVKEDFLPHFPVLYPNAPQVRELSANDAAALSAFYDSLHSLADLVKDWWQREGQFPVTSSTRFCTIATRAWS